MRCRSAEEFSRGVQEAIAAPGDRASLRRYAAHFDWQTRMEMMLQGLKMAA